MKLRHQCLALMIGLCMANAGYTSAGDDSGGGGGSGANTQKKIMMYLLRLGQYSGYNLDTDPKEQKKSISEEFLAVTSEFIVKKDQFQQLFYKFLGAIPTSQTPSGETTMAFVPKNNPYSTMNEWANKSFPNYASFSQTGVSVSPLLDQSEPQADPVSQAVLDILGTPNVGYCFNAEGTAWIKCSYLQTSPNTLNNSEVTNYAIIGAVPLNKTGNEMIRARLPPRDKYFSYEYNRPLLGQLNTNSLLGPLMYSMEGKSSTSSGDGGDAVAGVGLTAENQAQQAANFIRYATNAVLPLALSEPKDYDELYAQAIDPNPSVERFKAQSLLETYLASLRIYAAQSSVGISNMYEMLARRMPQGAQQEGQEPSTAALEEFKMATWRLFSPTQSQDPGAKTATWTEQLNTASGATVQKEIAVLLAEINYQLYLSRQQQERMLLTNSLMLMLNLQNAQPNLRTLMAKSKN